MTIISVEHRNIIFFLQLVSYNNTRLKTFTVPLKMFNIPNEFHSFSEPVRDQILRLNNVRALMCDYLIENYCLETIIDCENTGIRSCRIGYEIVGNVIIFGLLGVNITLFQINSINVWVAKLIRNPEFIERNYNSLDFLIIPRLDINQIFNSTNNIYTIVEYILTKTDYIPTIRQFINNNNLTVVPFSTAIDIELELICASVQILNNFAYGCQLQTFFRVGSIHTV